VRADGTVKLLDFGLAKALSQESESIDDSPTISPAGVTLDGAILGTAAYMSPEQTRGKALDKRTDIWAFGCVFYEMLSGRRAFDAETVTDTLAAVVTRDPDWTALPDRVPEQIRLLLKRCLAKDRNERVPDIAVARFLMTETVASSTSVVSASRPRVLIGAGVALAAAALVLGVFAGLRYASGAAAPAATIRFEVLPPAGVTLQPSPVASAAQLALSPDGAQLAFVAAHGGRSSEVWVRRLDSTQAQPLAGTEGASFPFWSHDSRFVAFFAAGKLKTVDTRGGAPQTLADAAAGRGGTWSQDGVILFAAQASSPIFRVAASGGAVTPVTKFDASQGIVTQYWPHFLPDGRHFLYYQRSTQPNDQGIFVASLDSPDGTRVIDSGTRAVYTAGHLLFVRDGILFAQAFDERTLGASGEPSRVADGVGYWASAFAYAAFTASRAGAIAYGPSVVLTTSLRWRDRAGAASEPALAPRPYVSPRLSPDETSVMVAITDVETAQPDLWQMALSRGTISRVTTDASSDWFPVWSSDATRVFFGSARRGATQIFQKAGVAAEEIISDRLLGAATYPIDVSRDGRLLLFMQSTSRGYDLGVMSLTGDRRLDAFLAGPFNEVQGRFSPNMRWIAYASDESGRFEVYVRGFPADSSRSTTISIGGGMQPEWRRDGKELFYVSADGKLTAVSVDTDAPAFTAGAPRPLFEVRMPEPTAPYPNHYALTGDGQRFLVNTVVEQPTQPALTVILNWTAQ
jgi:Tol biopolymer transport system component